MHYLRGTTAITDELSLGWQQVQLGSGWQWLCQTWGKLVAAFHRNHPSSPLATKTFPQKANTAACVSISSIICWQKTQHELAACSHNTGRQPYPELHLKEHGQQAMAGDFLLLLHSGETLP